MDRHLALAQDLSARICHDLGGPLGGVTAALELLKVEDEAGEIARDGVGAMTRRLRLWRAVAGGGAGPLNRDGIAALLDGALGNGRATIDPLGLPEADLPAPAAQAVLAAAMLAAEALPRGGVVHLAGDAAGIAVWPEGRDASWPHALTAVLAGGEASGPRDVLAPLLLSLAVAAGLDANLLFGGPGAAPPLLLRTA